jgi:hypothetical protein
VRLWSQREHHQDEDRESQAVFYAQAPDQLAGRTLRDDVVTACERSAERCDGWIGLCSPDEKHQQRETEGDVEPSRHGAESSAELNERQTRNECDYRGWYDQSRRGHETGVEGQPVLDAESESPSNIGDDRRTEAAAHPEDDGREVQQAN